MSCNIPAKIGAGLSFSSLLTLTAFPAPDWVVTLILRGPMSITLTAVAEGAQHKLHAPPSLTAGWTPGRYWFALRASDGTDVVDVEAGEVIIVPDLAVMPADYDGRTQAQVSLEAIEAVIAKRATLDQERYRINNRELYRTPIADLLKLRDFYREQVKREALAASGGNPFGRVVRVRIP